MEQEPKTYEQLTDLQKRFVDFYIKFWKPTKAARMAGYSEATAKQMAYENLTKPYLQTIIKSRAAMNVASEGEIASRLTYFSRGSLKSFLDHDGNPIISRDNKDIDLAKKLKIKRTVIRPKNADPIEHTDYEIEIEDRQSALDKLAKMLGMYKGEAKNEIDNPYANLPLEDILKELEKLGLKVVKDDTNTTDTGGNESNQ